MVDNKKKTEENRKKITLNKNQTISLYQNKEKELQRLSSKLQELENIYREINKAQKTLQELEKIKNKEKVMVNIGAGVLMACEVSNNTEIKVMLPGSIIIDKSVSDVLKDLEDRKKELKDAKEKLINAYKNTLNTLNAIKDAIQKMNVSQDQTKTTTTNVN
jgi:prefoldin alpha subunit